jgi:WhiB family redox-sensing transcriptional regulator
VTSQTSHTRQTSQTSSGHHRGPNPEEVPAMQLAALLDRLVQTEHETGPQPQVRATPCQREDSELWFADTPTEVELAKSLCGDCPAATACLAGALERREPWGVWGGELFENGVVVARKRPRGRPRKDDPRYTEPASAQRTAHEAAVRLVEAAGYRISAVPAQRDDELVA